MIEKRISLVLIVLSICIFSASISLAECELPGDTMTEGAQEGTFFANIFICPYDPVNTPISEATPCPSMDMELGDYYGGSWSYSDSKGAGYAGAEGEKFANEQHLNWKITFETDGVCFAGREGDGDCVPT